MKRIIISTAIAFLLLAGMWACTNIDKLSDINTVATFKISTHTPQEIMIGEAEIIDDNFIYIPIKYGIDKFPLKFDADVSFKGAIDRVLGADISKTITLQSIDEPLVFTVVAESGLPRKYTIMARAIDYTLPAEIPFQLLSNSSANTIIYEKAFIADDILTIYAVNAEYPITLRPKFESNLIEFKNFVNGETDMIFQTSESVHKLIIVDKANCSSKDITVRLKNLEGVNGSDGDYSNTDIDSRDFKATMQGKDGIMEYKGHELSNDADSIFLYAYSLGTESGFPVTFSLVLGDLKDYIRLVDFTGEVTFNAYGETVSFYMIDLDKQINRKWNVTLVEFELPEPPTAADVLAFTFDYTAYRTESDKDCITLDDAVEIYPDNGEIWLKMTEHSNTLEENNWNVTLNNVVITAATGATFTTPEFKWAGSNNAWTAIKSFDVSSPKGMVKTWKVGIKDYRDYVESGECNINSAEVSSVSPANASVLSTQAEIDQNNKIILIRLAEDAYPLSIRVNYALSQYATIISQENNTQPLVFAAQNSEVIVTVRAENLINTQNYTVKLVAPPMSSEANITAFNAGTLSPTSFGISNVNLNAAEQEIVLSLNQSGSCPLTVNYTMELSRKATADKSLSGSLVFANLAVQNTITVTAEDGTQKQWKVKIADYTPQLTNWEMEDWSGNDPQPKGTSAKPYWATANTTGLITMTGTKKATGYSGSGAQLSSLRAPVVNRLASASLFLGYFNSSNVLGGLSDPVSLTFQGIPFSASKKIIGIDIAVNYTSAGSNSDDTGAVTIELIKHNSSSAYIYHGKRPDGNAHPNNTAIPVARGRKVFGNIAATINGETVNVVTKNTWQTVRILFDYSTMSDVFDYTHLLVICASSSQGDAFIGQVGSTLLLDNIKLIYEGDE